MRRKARGTVINLAVFCLALFFILYVNRPQSAKRTFEWTTIRYKTTSAALPKARGICPGLRGSPKPALVVARVAAEDSKWLDALGDRYHLCVYTADAPTDKASPYLQVPSNRGHEAMAYLTFLIDNHADIPAAGAVFVHGSRWAWHNDAPDYDNAALLAALNVSAALEPSGYHNLRCDWSASTCSPSEAPPQGSMETLSRALLEPWNSRVASDAALPRALAALFGGDERTVLLGRTDAVRAQCCAQFAVSRDRIWQHSRDEYVALRQWLLDGSSSSSSSGGGGDSDSSGPTNQLSQQGQYSGRHGEAAPADDRVAGRILSYIWHILFAPPQQGESSGADGVVDLAQLNALACPSAEECYCRLYGRCNLSGCTDPGRCMGQYEVPPNFRLPEDWAARHSL